MPITSSYTSNFLGGPVTTPAPSPGSQPIVQIQNDGYVITSANAFQQHIETLADYVGYLQHFPDGYLTYNKIWIDGYSGGTIAGNYHTYSFINAGKSNFQGEADFQALSYFNAGAYVTGNFTTTGTGEFDNGLNVYNGFVVLTGNTTFHTNTEVLAAGTLSVDRYGSGVGTPSPAITVGGVYKDSVPVAWGMVRNNAGSLSMPISFGVSSISHAATGLVDITMANAAGGSDQYIVLLTIDYTNTSSAQIIRYSRTSTTVFRVDTHDVGLTGRDADFAFTVLGYF